MIENIILGKLQITCCTVTEQKVVIRAFFNRLSSSVCSVRVFVLLECLLLQSPYTLISIIKKSISHIIYGCPYFFYINVGSSDCF